MSPPVTTEPDVLTVFSSAEFRADPVPTLHWLLDEQPVHRTRKGFYLISRYSDVDQLSGHDLVHRPDRARLSEQFPAAQRHRSMRVLLDSMVMANPPEHTRLRRLIGRAFTPHRVDGLRARIGAITDEVLAQIAEPLLDGESVDLHHCWAEPVTLQVLSELLGVPESDRRWLAATVLHISDGIASADEQRMVLADEQTELLDVYFRDLAARKRRQPADDLISALVGTPDEPAPGDLFGVLWLLWLAGFESSASMMDHGALALFDHPDQASRLDGDHQAGLAFADEVLRHSVVELFTPIPRIAARDLVLSGVDIPAGADLRPMIAAANRDPRMFPDPDRFDPARGNAVAGFAFGQGLHRCVGAFLARAELAIGLARLRRRFPTLGAAGELALVDDIVSTRMTRAFPVALSQ
ncbi:cytochrome P450 [Kutzneria sp. CA-103260]|uniref:cytochrome P450 n=1 Tax=Kutzneria sp. CA-103260 TaxID=2802641 RepID=UPI001BAB1257|nr:cytochrome P450 [Kutzneria sp. CA-103260]QUQ65530.1 cytochrome P450 [Kutzneria sp. CA-103260]